MMEKDVCDFTFNGVVGMVCVDLWQGVPESNNSVEVYTCLCLFEVGILVHFRLHFEFAVQSGLKIHQMDVTAAFLKVVANKDFGRQRKWILTHQH